MRRPLSLLGEVLRDGFDARELAWQLFLRDIRSNYRQSLLGYLWAFLPPLAWAFVFVLLQKRGVIQTAPVGENYTAFVLAGLVCWHTFVDALQAPLRGFVQSRSLIARVAFPREAILLAACGEVIFQWVVRTPLLVWAWWAAGAPSGLHLIAVPIGVAALILAGMGIGVMLLPLGLLYQDVRPALALSVSFWLLVTPVAYSQENPGRATLITQWNPVSPLIETTRGWLFGSGPGADGSFLVVAIAATILILGGWIAFRVAMPHAVARLGS